MKLFSNSYDQLIEKFEDAKAVFAHIDRSKYQEQQRAIDAAGVAIIDFERKTKIDLGRELVQREGELHDRIKTFRELVTQFTALNQDAEALITDLADGRVPADQAEARAMSVEYKKSTLELLKATVEKTEGYLANNLKEQASLTKTALADSKKRDPLSRDERLCFGSFYDQARASRATNEVIEEALAPLPV
jgi:hypothetical protein